MKLYYYCLEQDYHKLHPFVAENDEDAKSKFSPWNLQPGHDRLLSRDDYDSEENKKDVEEIFTFDPEFRSVWKQKVPWNLG